MKLRWSEEITIAEANKKLKKWRKDKGYELQQFENDSVITYLIESSSTYSYLVVGKTYAVLSECWKK